MGKGYTGTILFCSFLMFEITYGSKLKTKQAHNIHKTKKRVYITVLKPYRIYGWIREPSIHVQDRVAGRTGTITPRDS